MTSSRIGALSFMHCVESANSMVLRVSSLMAFCNRGKTSGYLSVTTYLPRNCKEGQKAASTRSAEWKGNVLLAVLRLAQVLEEVIGQAGQLFLGELARRLVLVDVLRELDAKLGNPCRDCNTMLRPKDL
jgi:hypothetical protein